MLAATEWNSGAVAAPAPVNRALLEVGETVRHVVDGEDDDGIAAQILRRVECPCVEDRGGTVAHTGADARPEVLD